MPTGIGVITISRDGGRGHPPCAGLGQWSRNASGARRKLPRGLRTAPICLELGQWPQNCAPQHPDHCDGQQGSTNCFGLGGQGMNECAPQWPEHVTGEQQTSGNFVTLPGSGNAGDGAGQLPESCAGMAHILPHHCCRVWISDHSEAAEVGRLVAKGAGCRVLSTEPEGSE
jgi:hypothetical protein